MHSPKLEGVRCPRCKSSFAVGNGKPCPQCGETNLEPMDSWTWRQVQLGAGRVVA